MIYNLTDAKQLSELADLLIDGAMKDPILGAITRETVDSTIERHEVFAVAWRMGAIYVMSEMATGRLTQLEPGKWTSKN